ncbi:MAG: 50S ribosomal protein L3, partial [Parvibaculum sp.]
LVRDAVKTALPDSVPMPGAFRRNGEAAAAPVEAAPAEAPAEEAEAPKEGA